jgi:hypothetical protein
MYKDRETQSTVRTEETVGMEVTETSKATGRWCCLAETQQIPKLKYGWRWNVREE